jgi:hypothetical protein
VATLHRAAAALRRFTFILYLTLNLMAFYGIMGVYVTPNLVVASVLSGFFYGAPASCDHCSVAPPVSLYCLDSRAPFERMTLGTDAQQFLLQASGICLLVRGITG